MDNEIGVIKEIDAPRQNSYAQGLQKPFRADGSRGGRASAARRSYKKARE